MFSKARHVARQVLRLLPKPIRHRVYRSLMSVPEIPRELTVRLARSQDELEAAFSLLHDAYVREGFMEPHPSGLRVTPYHALPSTSTLIALWNEKVVGTLSIIRDNPFGLPLDSIFDVGRLRKKPRRIAEISALAIAKSHRGQRGQILFPLFKYLYQYCIEYFGVDSIVIAVNPRDADMYEALLFFEKIESRRVDHYNFVNGAPAVGRFLDLNRAYDLMGAAFLHRPAEKNPFVFFTQTVLPHLKFPDHRNEGISDPIMTPALLDHFFNKRTRVFDEMSVRSKAILHSMYRAPAYQSVLPPLADLEEILPLRAHRRHEVKVSGLLHYSEGNLLPILIHAISQANFCAYFDLPLPRDEEFTLQFPMKGDCKLEIRAMVCWMDGAGTYGFIVADPPDAWIEMVNRLESALDQEAG